MNKMTGDIFRACHGKLDPKSRLHCCEVFGLDFMIDDEFKPYLIEVNTNPCLEETSSLLKHLLPRMIDDAFKLTIDVLYPPLKQDVAADNTNNSEECFGSSDEIFPVVGYPNTYNMWGDRVYKFRAPPLN